MEKKIQILLNAIYFFVTTAIIIDTEDEENRYRLIVIDARSRMVIDQTYPTLRGAKIAFSKYFLRRSWSAFRSHWSQFYQPDQSWLDSKCIDKQKSIEIQGSLPVTDHG